METLKDKIIKLQDEIIELLQSSQYFEVIEAIKRKKEELSRLKDGGEDKLTCTDKCRWFNIGYGHCNFCIRQVKEHDCRDNFKPAEQSDKLTAEEIKKIATDFFYYWWNTPKGNNTSEGFDEWWKLHKQEYASQFVGEVTDRETQYEKSLRLIDEYFEKTPKEEIQKLIDKYESRPKWRRILGKLM